MIKFDSTDLDIAFERDAFEVTARLRISTRWWFYGHSPLLPELATGGESLVDALENDSDSSQAVIEIYRDLGREVPIGFWSGDKK